MALFVNDSSEPLAYQTTPSIHSQPSTKYLWAQPTLSGSSVLPKHASDFQGHSYNRSVSTSVFETQSFQQSRQVPDSFPYQRHHHIASQYDAQPPYILNSPILPPLNQPLPSQAQRSQPFASQMEGKLLTRICPSWSLLTPQLSTLLIRTFLEVENFTSSAVMCP